MKTKTLISCPVTAQLICVFVFTFAKCRVSYDVAHMSRIVRKHAFCICENKGADQLHSVTAQLISAFVFTTLIVQSLFCLQKFTTYMGLVVRKPVFRVSDQVSPKPGCTATEDIQKLEILYIGSRGIVLAT